MVDKRSGRIQRDKNRNCRGRQTDGAVRNQGSVVGEKKKMF